ncbi:MAG: tRNA (adenosine(37)-N6)-dimethylallyltransferase MiaA [Verrucomicrobia bacterium]|nr:tRNA (adenosine(37)-N6)-dimethylallyltransferase MiaA [Verrucomicrobiota bacterium]
MSMDGPEPWFIVGPTASGKSAIAMELARRVGAEIISVDSMQVYQGMDIGTSKPTAQDRRDVPHHLLDVCEVRVGFDAARFCVLAKEAMEGIRARNRRAIFCGGSGLYFKAWLEGLGEAPPADPGLRQALETIPDSELVAELRAKDPLAAASMDLLNRRRVLRAVEVIRLTGKPFSSLRADWGKRDVPPEESPSIICLHREREDLRERMDRRIDEMVRAGWVEETRGLMSQGLMDNPVALQAIGYRQFVGYLQEGGDLSTVIEEIRLRTRRYAKRQQTWFRHQLTTVPLELPRGEAVASSADRVMNLLQPL